MIKAAGFGYRFDGASQPSLLELDFQVRSGEFLLVCGPNGCGKSSLLKALAGLFPAYGSGQASGRLEVLGLDAFAAEPSDFFGRVAWAGSDASRQFLASSVREEWEFGLFNKGKSEAEIPNLIQETARTLGLTNWLEHPPRKLSAGQQKLVLLGGLLVLGPQVLLVDEPMANLSPAAQRLVAAALRRAKAEGTTLVVADHHLEPFWPLADKILLLDSKGSGSPSLPAQAFSHPFVQACFEPAPEPQPAVLSSPSASPLWAVENLEFAWHSGPRLEKITWNVAEGSQWVLWGENGSGKTTLLKLLRGILRPQRGKILYRTKPLPRALARLAAQIGWVDQNPDRQFFCPTVIEELRWIPRLLRRPNETWIQQLLNVLGLAPLAHRPPFFLSDGQKRRLSLALALVTQPATLLLDEPTANLDPWARNHVLGALHDAQPCGTSWVMATHDPWALVASQTFRLSKPSNGHDGSA